MPIDLNSPIRRVLVTSSALPPMVSGSAKMMRNLFSPFPKESLVLLRGNNAMFPLGQASSLGPAVIADMPNIFRRFQFRIGLSQYLEYLWVPYLALRMAGLARRRGVSAIFANYPYGYFLLASWLASRITGLPFYAYMHDLWEETVDARGERWIAHLLEGRIFRDAAAVYVPTEDAIAHYRQKHDIEARLLPHAVNLEDGAAGAEGAPRGGEAGPPQILFTGGIYHMNRDAVVAMVGAVEGMQPVPERGEVKLLLCTGVSRRALSAVGICGKRIEARFVDTQTAMRLQKEADLLYLPLAFETPWPDEIRTVFPTKAVEYLVSGTPILLHGPADCFTVKDAREQGWAHVIDTKDPEALREGIRRLVVDRSLREKLVENARAEAVRRDARRIAKGLQEDLGLL